MRRFRVVSGPTAGTRAPRRALPTTDTMHRTRAKDVRDAIAAAAGVALVTVTCRWVARRECDDHRADLPAGRRHRGGRGAAERRDHNVRLSVLLLNFFFLPPVGRFAIADPQNRIVLLVFLAVS